ncbi:MAG: hypothetical protein Q8910_00645 [Bacteroidota bacterium]|nr:hypothetical protein [Bacteroidota bacterium]
MINIVLIVAHSIVQRIEIIGGWKVKKRELINLLEDLYHASDDKEVVVVVHTYDGDEDKEIFDVSNGEFGNHKGKILLWV